MNDENVNSTILVSISCCYCRHRYILYTLKVVMETSHDAHLTSVKLDPAQVVSALVSSSFRAVTLCWSLSAVRDRFTALRAVLGPDSILILDFELD